MSYLDDIIIDLWERDERDRAIQLKEQGLREGVITEGEISFVPNSKLDAFFDELKEPAKDRIPHCAQSCYKILTKVVGLSDREIMERLHLSQGDLNRIKAGHLKSRRSYIQFLVDTLGLFNNFHVESPKA